MLGWVIAGMALGGLLGATVTAAYHRLSTRAAPWPPKGYVGVTTKAWDDLRAECAKLREIAAAHTVTWKGWKADEPKWVRAHERIGYAGTMDANLAHLRRDLEIALKGYGRLRVELRLRVSGAWVEVLPGWRVKGGPLPNTKWTEVGAYTQTFTGVTVDEVCTEIETHLKGLHQTGGLWDSATRNWRAPQSPIELLACVEVEKIPPPKPEIRFVEVPVAVTPDLTQPVPSPPPTLPDDERLAALIETQVALELAKRHQRAGGG